MFAWKVLWSMGIATLTTVESMNAILDPRIVAARIQGCAASQQGAAVRPERIAASSQGAFIAVWMQPAESPALKLANLQVREEIPPATWGGCKHPIMVGFRKRSVRPAHKELIP